MDSAAIPSTSSTPADVPKPKPKRFRPPKPRTPALRRGSACLNCRRLKIRCDGVQPVCNNCIRVPKEECCTFNAPPHRRRRHAPASASQLGFFSPVSKMETEAMAQWLSEVDFASPSESAMSTPTSAFAFDEVPFEYVSSAFTSPEMPTVPLPFENSGLLVDHFLPHAAQCGFFLDAEQFRATADACTTSDPLLSAARLWGAHLSGLPDLMAQIPDLLRAALQQTALDICVPAPSAAECTRSSVVRTIQTLILLANYFLLVEPNLLAARVQANVADTLVAWCALDGNAFGDGREGREETDPELESVREDVNRAYWSVLGLQTTLASV
ncbi:Zn(2)-C6 fungal-type domain-containing protein [Mycena kentingensis (nom. inval.)]|nr:Zn(2)-C6 fungal-type domain-containing protein [Mycena kentingensis (nom. inval.)]